MYNKDYNFLLSPYHYKEYLNYKRELLDRDDENVLTIKLETFNDSPIHIVNALDLSFLERKYLKTIFEDFFSNEDSFNNRNFDDIALSRIYSEVEGTLNIESVPTTRKAIEEFVKGTRDPKTHNDQIIKNMIDAIDYINAYPEFNEKNLYKLYLILSYKCLDDEDKLLDGNIYRHNGVEVGGYLGCPHDKIKVCMDSLFNFVNSNLKNSDLKYLLPHISHYYVAYIHPYFDYNGRTARMVSYWVSLLCDKDMFPPLVSEAINQSKAEYYNALSETRDANNDLTYFLLYIFKVSIKYFDAYRLIEAIYQDLMNKKDVVLSSTEKAYFKKILISNKGKFTHYEFTKWIGVDMSKQGALKVLNNLESYGLLTSELSKSNSKLFRVSDYVLNLEKYSL